MPPLKPHSSSEVYIALAVNSSCYFVMVVTRQDIKQTLRTLRLSTQVVCLHSSLRSFGQVEGGATALIQSFLDEGCTLLFPTFSSGFEIAPPRHLQFERNGWNYSAVVQHDARV